MPFVFIKIKQDGAIFLNTSDFFKKNTESLCLKIFYNNVTVFLHLFFINTIF